MLWPAALAQHVESMYTHVLLTHSLFGGGWEATLGTKGLPNGLTGGGFNCTGMLMGICAAFGPSSNTAHSVRK